MKTSIFDMNFVLPPLAVMTEVDKDRDINLTNTFVIICICDLAEIQENGMKTSLSDMRQMLSTVTRQPTSVGYFYGGLYAVIKEEYPVA